MTKKCRTHDPITGLPIGLPDEIRYLLFSANYEDMQEVIQLAASELERLNYAFYSAHKNLKEVVEAVDKQRNEFSRDREKMNDQINALQGQLQGIKSHYYMTVISGSGTTRS